MRHCAYCSSCILLVKIRDVIVGIEGFEKTRTFGGFFLDGGS